MILLAANVSLALIGLLVFKNIDIRQRIKGVYDKTKRLSNSSKIIAIAFMVFLLSFMTLRVFVHNSMAALAISILPPFCTYYAYDIFSKAKERREASQLVYFLMSMSKWSAVRNDIVFCLGKTSETSIGKPLDKLISGTLSRIQGGMDVIRAFQVMEQESRSQDLRYLVRNIRFAAERGGNLHRLFTGLERQYFRIDEEIFKRKISTARDRATVYITLIVVAVASIWFLSSNPSAKEFYMNTEIGNIILMLFSLVFSSAMLFMTGRGL